MSRPWEARELRMTVDYLIQAHPEAKHMTRVRVGPLPSGAEAAAEEGISPRMYIPVLHWADGVALYPDHIVLLEVKVKLHSDALGQILTNLDLFPDTPEFNDRRDLPISPEVVYAYPDRETLRMLDRHGIRAVRFRPDYIEAYYVEQLQKVYEPRPKVPGIAWERITRGAGE